MKKTICRILSFVLCIVVLSIGLISCEVSGTYQDKLNTQQAANNLQSNQPTPTDLEYSLERYNLIRRAYWVNGQREKADTLPCAVEKPLGYIILISGNTIIGRFVVDGKVSSLNSFLTPDSEYYTSASSCDWLADVDGPPCVLSSSTGLP